MIGRPCRPRLRAALGALALVFLLARAIPAAEPSDAKKPPGRYRVGSIYLTPRVELKSAGVDSNVFNAETGAVSDSAVTLSPSLEAALPVGRKLRFTSRGVLDFNWFRDHVSERSTDRGLRFRGEADWGRLTFFGEMGFARRKQRFSIDLDPRLPYSERSAATGVLLRAARKLTLGATVMRSRFDIASGPGSAGIESSLDRTTRSLGAELNYALTRRTALLLSSEAIRDRFATAIGAGGRDASSLRHLAGVSFATPSFLSGRLQAGVRTFSRDRSGAAPPYRGAVLKCDLALPLSHLARLGFGAEREVYYSAEPGISEGALARNSFVSKRYEASVAAELPFDLLGRAFAVSQRADYELPYLVSGAVTPRESRLHTYGVSVLRVLSESLKLGGGVAWDHRASTRPGGGYRATRYGFQAEFTP